MYKRKADLVFKVLTFACLTTMLVLIIADTLAEPLSFKIVQARGGLNVREYPRIDARAVYLLEDTEIVAVLCWLDGWAEVAKNRAPFIPLGWVCGDYLK